MLVSVIRQIPGKYRFFTSLTGKRRMRFVVPVLLLNITFVIFYPSLIHGMALDGMTATGIRPLRYGLHLGVLSIFFAFGLLVWVLYIDTNVGRAVPGWSSLMVVVLFFSSIQFILIGLLGSTSEKYSCR